MDILSPVVSALKVGWQFYQDVQNASEQVKRSMRTYQIIMEEMELTQKKLQKKPKSGSNKPHFELIKKIADGMKSDADAVAELLRKWNHLDFATWRFPALERLTARGIFTITGQGDALKALVDELNTQQGKISNQFTFMTYNNTDPTNAISTPTSSKINILFLDDRNQGRSIVAQAYAQLVSAWTRNAKLAWPINKIMSAGLYVSNRSGLHELQEELDFKMQPGNETPYRTAVESVFENNSSLPDDLKLHEKFQKHKSRGLSRDAFMTYDYIFVFMPQHKRDVENLITATKKKYGTTDVPPEKSNVVLLGKFDGSKFDNIWNAKKDNDPVKQRANWDACERKIRLSFQGWLQKTQKWQKPPKVRS